MSFDLKEDTPVKIGELYNLIREKITHLSKAATIDFLSYLTNIDRNLVLSNFNNLFLVTKKALSDIELVYNGYPVSYLRGKHNFYGYEFFVNENVLIPRVETEILIDTVKSKLGSKKNIKILDICTGSGCILLTLLNELEESIGVGIDISFDALKVAKKNIENMKLDYRANLINADALILNNYLKGDFDIITMNPPYVSKNDNFDEFLKYEPDVALFVKGDNTFFYKKMLFILNKLCKKGGLIFYEIGYNQVEKLSEIYKGENIEFIEDYFGHKRVMVWKN